MAPQSVVEKKEVLILGPSSSGKSVLMGRMKEIYSNYGIYASFPPYVATVGVDVTTVALPNADGGGQNGKAKSAGFLDIREVGGSLSARWKSYIPFCSYVVYTIDISDPTQFSTAYVLLHEMLATWSEIAAKEQKGALSSSHSPSVGGDIPFCSNWSCVSAAEAEWIIAPDPNAGGSIAPTSAGAAIPAKNGVWTSLTAAEKIAAAELEAEKKRNLICHRQRPVLIIAFTKTDLLGKSRLSCAASMDATSTREATGVAAAEPYELSRVDSEEENDYLSSIDELVASVGLDDCLRRYTGLFETVEVMCGTSFVAAGQSIKSTKGGKEVSDANGSSNSDGIKSTLPYQICSWLRYN